MEEKFSALMRSSEGFIFFVIKGISWGFVKLNACWFLVLISHLGDRLNLFLLLNLSHWSPINQHTHMLCPLAFYPENAAEVDAKVRSVNGRMPRPYSPVQNAHQAFLLITAQCVLRIQTGREVHFCS